MIGLELSSCPSPSSWFEISSLPVFGVNMVERREAGHWGSMGGHPLFPCIACNELSQPLMASLTEATRQNRSPSWQSGQAGRWTHSERLIRVWPWPVQLLQALCMRLMLWHCPRWLLEAGVSRGCLDLPFDPRANQPDLWLPLLWSSVHRLCAVLCPGCPEKPCPAVL